MHYTGTWSLSNSAVYVGGKARISSTKNSTASVSFRGNRVGWYSRLGPAYGQAKVYIDGAFVKTVNLNAAAVFDRKLVFTKNWTAVGNHSIRIVVVGTRSSEDRGRPDLLPPVAATGSDALSRSGSRSAATLRSSSTGRPCNSGRACGRAGREIPLAAADVRTAIHDPSPHDASVGRILKVTLAPHGKVLWATPTSERVNLRPHAVRWP